VSKIRRTTSWGATVPFQRFCLSLKATSKRDPTRIRSSWPPNPNAIDLPASEYRVYEIGGADQMSYADIMRAYARMRGMRLVMIPVPVLTPFISSLWLGLVTPLYRRIGRTLVESIVHSTVVRERSARARHPTARGLRRRGPRCRRG